MSKIVTILLVNLLTIFSILPFQVLADTPNCSSSAISYGPNAFSANPSDVTLNFNINNKTAAENIKNKGNVRLHFIAPEVGFLGDINTKSVPVTITDSGGTFTINVLNIDDNSPFRSNRIDALKGRGQHEAVLDWQGVNSPNFDEFCKGISYYVANPDTCVIDPAIDKNPPLSIPPRTPLTIKFSGKPNTKYLLHVRGGFGTPSGDATTYGDGQGSFNSLTLSGNSGDTLYIDLYTNDLTGDPNCSTKIKLDINAPQPGPPSSSVPTPGPGAGTVPAGKPITTSSGAKVCQPGDLTCTTGGGTPCDGTNGIATAIGCIHTNPIELVKDLFKFLVAIGGGVAFLMMLLGAFQMITSAGNPETLQAGRDRFTSAIIGLLMVIFAVLLLQIIGVGILAIPGFK